MSKPRLIAFYLPQFYPTPENDEWWGKGFTEWTNVGRAKPLFKGHYQPRVPADLGYYDLRVPEVREQQAKLAREAGIEGFCYWHYWFAGRRLLDRVFSEVVESGKPDYPFCLCWANHSWYKKTWDPTQPDKLLIEQTYSGEQDYINHFYTMLPAFKDHRYIKIDGKLLFGIYAPMDFHDFITFKNIWNKLAQENGLGGFHFTGFTFKANDCDSILQKQYDSVIQDNIAAIWEYTPNWKKIIIRIRNKIKNIPRLIEYEDYMNIMVKLFNSSNPKIYPCINPNFDHSPRSSRYGTVVINNNPKLWYEFCTNVFQMCKYRNHENNIIFIKAWNEWGEGNYMEPDLKYGKAYIEQTKKAYDRIN